MPHGGHVDLIVAGVQKGGTTALFDHLGDMPDIGLSRIKETHFFDDERIDWRAPDYARYHALFPQDAAVRAEATPIYAYWPNAMERIRAYNPAMKIVLLVRDPVERAWSHWKMEYARGLETEPFAWCIREGRARVAAGDPTAPGHHRVHSYVERGFYGRQLQRILTLFPYEQVRVYDAALLRSDPDPILRDLCAFAGVRAPVDVVQPRAVHVGQTIDYPSTLSAADFELLTDLYAADTILFTTLTRRA
jgi:hypothetical protein